MHWVGASSNQKPIQCSFKKVDYYENLYTTFVGYAVTFFRVPHRTAHIHPLANRLVVTLGLC